MKKTLTKASSKKTSKKKSLPKSVRASKKSLGPNGRLIGWVVKKNGQLETAEEREKRLIKKEALTLRAFQMAYDNHHRK
jgi:hypothetical protein